MININWFKEEYQEKILKDSGCTNVDYEGWIPNLIFIQNMNEVNQISGAWEYIVKLIPILKEMEYGDFHLKYEDSDIWTLQWHDPFVDYSSWVLTEGEQ